MKYLRKKEDLSCPYCESTDVWIFHSELGLHGKEGAVSILCRFCMYEVALIHPGPANFNAREAFLKIREAFKDPKIAEKTGCSVTTAEEE